MLPVTVAVITAAPLLPRRKPPAHSYCRAAILGTEPRRHSYIDTNAGNAHARLTQPRRSRRRAPDSSPSISSRAPYASLPPPVTMKRKFSFNLAPVVSTPSLPVSIPCL